MPFLKNDERGLHEKHCANCNNELEEVNNEKVHFVLRERRVAAYIM